MGPVSNYYKALSILCSHLIISKLRKTPKNHTEIFLFLKVSFPEVYEIVDAVFTLCRFIFPYNEQGGLRKTQKDAIHKIAGHGGIEKNLKHILKRYKQVADIIIFGSYVKGEKIPKDIDLAIMAKEKNLDFTQANKERYSMGECTS